MKLTIKHTCALLLLAGSLPLAHAAEDQPTTSTPDGVKVDKMSSLRKLVPAEQLEAQAAQQYEGMKQQARQQNALAPDNHAELKRLRTIANKLIPFAQTWNERAPRWQWEVNLLGSNQINAFCMPGGKIAFYSGIISKLKLTDDEVAMVMGHEIAHALREHGRERLAKSGATALAARLAGAGIAHWLKIDPNVTQNVADGAAKLTILKFSRDDESEADVVGLDIAARAGFDPRAGVTLWQKMGAANKGAPPQWLSTHPAGENRIAEIRKQLPNVMPLYAKARGIEVARLPAYKSNVSGLAPVQ